MMCNITRLVDFAFECNLLVRSQGLLECVLGAWEVRNCLRIRDYGVCINANGSCVEHMVLH